MPTLVLVLEGPNDARDPCEALLSGIVIKFGPFLAASN